MMYGKAVLEIMLSLESPVSRVEECIVSSLTSLWRHYESYAASIVSTCIRNNRWNFLETFLSRSKIDVNYDHGRFGREALDHESIRCMQIMLLHGLDVSVSTTRIVTSFYEGNVCNGNGSWCRNRKVTAVEHTVYHDTSRFEIVNAMTNMAEKLGDVHYHGIDTQFYYHHSLLHLAMNNNYGDGSMFRTMLQYASNDVVSQCINCNNPDAAALLAQEKTKRRM